MTRARKAKASKRNENDGSNEKEKNDTPSSSQLHSELAVQQQQQQQQQLPFSDQMEGILELMTQRASGRVNNRQVETAVDQVLESMGAPKSTPTPKKSTENPKSKPKSAMSTSSSQRIIQADMGNYDDDSGDDSDVDDRKDDTNNVANEDGIQEIHKQTHEPKMRTRAAKRQRLSKKQDSNSSSRRTNTRNNKKNNDNENPKSKSKGNQKYKYTTSAYKEILEDIPMGKVGSQMMTTFGDGPQPDPEALQLALEGTKRALQWAVMDARAVRRKATSQYAHAQEQALSGFKTGTFVRNGTALSQKRDERLCTTADIHTESKQNKDTTTKTTAAVPVVEQALVYRAMLTSKANAHDPLSHQLPCGFDSDQLKVLFPEEVRAYDRWNELHEEYEEKSNKKVATLDDEDGGTKTDGDENENKDDKQGQNYIGGHLTERNAIFDVRTVGMHEDKYIEFSRIRQGSFLPRRQNRTDDEEQWESLDTGRKGKTKRGSWMHMSAVAVRFLHWLGFEPPEVPPPDNETTQILAFLGYDRMGRIVEKAVLLRMAKDAEVNLSKSNLRELSNEEQLTKDDIQAALDDPDIKPVPLFPLEGETKMPTAQLYFGPGFEERLELEMEEMLSHAKKGKSKDSAQERDILKIEKNFFEKFSKPRKEKDAMKDLLEKHQKAREARSS